MNAHIPSREALDLVADAGMEWVRIDVLWSLVEPQNDTFAWTVYDRVVEDAQARGLRVFATISDTPAWATLGEPSRGVPDAADWYDICYRLASRYRGRVAAWGLWNEPNLARFWQGRRRDYIDVILKPGSAALRAGDPDGLVCAPDLAHLRSADWDSWLRDVLAEASDSIDVVTHHVYPDGPDAGSVVRQLTRDSQPWEDPSVKTVLRRAGWYGRPFWLTETGFDSASLPSGGESAQLSFVSNLLFDLFGPARDLAWVERLFLYELCDDPGFPANSWGLVGPPPEYRPKSAYRGVANFANSAIDDAEILAIAVPRRVTPSSTWEATVTVRNAGTTTWTTAAGYALGSPGDEDPFTFHRHYLDAGAAVAPGELVEFSIAMRSPQGVSPDGETLVTDWQMVREGAWWFGATARREILVSPSPEARTIVLGGAAHSEGLNNTSWRTDLLLHNSGTQVAKATLSLLEESGDNSSPRRVALTVPATTTLRVPDVVGTVFGRTGNAALRLELDSTKVSAASRTYTPRGLGSCGQYIPGLPVEMAAKTGQTAMLVGLAHSPDRRSGFRTNLGLVNVADTSTEIELAFFTDDGLPIAVRTLTLPGAGFIQRNDVFRELTTAAIAGGRIEVRPLSVDAKVMAYASLVDNLSGDPTLVLPALASDEPQIFVGVANNSGLNGTNWRTDVTLHNPTSEQARVELVLRVPGASARAAALDLPPGGQTRIADAVASLFGTSGAGTIELVTRGGAVAAIGRTFNDTPEGTYGEGLASIRTSQAAGFGDDVRLPHLLRNDGRANGSRTNVALVNVGSRPAGFGVQLFAGDGAYLGTIELELAAHERRQLTDVFSMVGATAVQDGLAVVRTRSGDARFFAYAAVVDNVTGDPTVIPGW